MGIEDDRTVGFLLWRHLGRNVHLHSIVVADEAQRRGVGSALLRFHRAESAREQPMVDTFTLHVLRAATWALPFYARHGYVARDPRLVPRDDATGLGDWIRGAYVPHGGPGPGKLLLVRGRGAPAG